MANLQQGLGRLIAPDQRDARYLMRAVLPTDWPGPDHRYYRTGPVLDQGSTSSCVGHAWRQWLSSAPLMTKSGPDAFAIYHEAQRVDEWAGENYDGTSVRAGAKVLVSRGHISEYRWAYDALDIAVWLLSGQGSVVLGTAWYSGMFTPDRHGFIRPTGRIVGGHAYLCIGYSADAGRFRIVNSWGHGWGQNGRAWIQTADLVRLLNEDGEAAAAVEIRL